MSAAGAAIVEELTAQLVDAVPDPLDWWVEEWTGPVDGITSPTVLVALDHVEPDPQGYGARRYAGRLLIVSPDELGTATVELEAVLAGLDRSVALTWTAARAATLDSKWPAWEVDVTVPLQFPNI